MSQRGGGGLSAAAERRARRRALLGLAAVVAVVVVVAVWFISRALNDSPSHSEDHPPYPDEYAVQMFEDETPFANELSQGQRPSQEQLAERHLRPGETVQYNSNPPTNGKHSGGAAAWGILEAPVPKEWLVHNMEHGGVIVWYNCEGGPAPLDDAACANLLDQLAGVVEPRVDEGMFVVLTPYADMEHRIALTAWQYLDAFDEFDAGRIEAFIASFECKFNLEGFCG